MSFFRYPGGKSKLKDCISDHLRRAHSGELEYREPFFGGGNIGIHLLTLSENRENRLFTSSMSFESIWINDRDVGIACLWTCVIKDPDMLYSKIQAYHPKTEDFSIFQDRLLSIDNVPDNSEHISDIAFIKLAIHQISYSGLGVKSGGPLGGRNPNPENPPKYPVDCRWSPDYICRRIANIHKIFSKFTVRENSCSSLDFSTVIKDTSQPCLLYLDPPYFVKGGDLYQYSFSVDDHIRLANDLKDIDHSWILSYDDCEEIREMYSWARIDEVNTTYSITGARSKKELIISKK